MKVRDKLEYFSKVAMQEAIEKKNDMAKEMEKEFNEAHAEAVRQTERLSSERIRNEKYKIEQMKNKEVMKAFTETKVMLIELRNNLTDQLFDNVEGRLRQFMQTDAYEGYLLDEIGKRTAGVKATIALMPRDMVYAEKIKLRTGLPVEEAREDFIGGFKLYIPQKSGVMDYSFQARLREERDTFNLFRIPERGNV